MATRRLTPLLALTLLAPLALGASSSLDQQDPQGDESISFNHPLLPQPLCDAPTADILQLRVRVEGDDLAASLRVRDITDAMTCGGASFGPAVRSFARVDLEGDRNVGVGFVTFRVSVQPLARVDACSIVFLATGGVNESCATLPWDAVFQGSEWTLRTPLQGTTSPSSGSISYDLRGQDYTVRASTQAFHGALVLGTPVTLATAMDSTSQATVSL